MDQRRPSLHGWVAGFQASVNLDSGVELFGSRCSNGVSGRRQGLVPGGEHPASRPTGSKPVEAPRRNRSPSYTSIDKGVTRDARPLDNQTGDRPGETGPPARAVPWVVDPAALPIPRHRWSLGPRPRRQAAARQCPAQTTRCQPSATGDSPDVAARRCPRVGTGFAIIRPRAPQPVRGERMTGFVRSRGPRPFVHELGPEVARRGAGGSRTARPNRGEHLGRDLVGRHAFVDQGVEQPERRFRPIRLRVRPAGSARCRRSGSGPIPGTAPTPSRVAPSSPSRGATSRRARPPRACSRCTAP